MSEDLDKAIAALNEKMSGTSFGGSAKFAIEGTGAIILDDNGARVSSDADDADVTLKADTDTFRSILDGDLNPTSAFMTGKLAVDGDMGMAMKLASVLS